MRFRALFRVSSAKRSKDHHPWPLSRTQTSSSRSSSAPGSSINRPAFGIAFDIDGVILRGRKPIGGSPQALRRLYDDCGSLKIPFLFLTNGGGVPESRRALELSELLGVNILPHQVVQGHSPFRNLVSRYENELILALGKGEPAAVMAEYGFKKVLSIDEYASFFEDIDPLSQYKKWTTMPVTGRNGCLTSVGPAHDIFKERVKAAFVVSDPVDWGRDIQVLSDILRSGGLPGQKNGYQPSLYFAADDLEYQATFPAERLGMGAFRIALQSVFNRIHHTPLQYTAFGKPNPLVFTNAESVLGQLLSSGRVNQAHDESSEYHCFRALYMIGDNPSVDVKGARQAGHPWISILTRTGVFRGKENHEEFPADVVVDTVDEAINYILRKECS